MRKSVVSIAATLFMAVGLINSAAAEGLADTPPGAMNPLYVNTAKMAFLTGCGMKAMSAFPATSMDSCSTNTVMLMSLADLMMRHKDYPGEESMLELLTALKAEMVAAQKKMDPASSAPIPIVSMFVSTKVMLRFDSMEWMAAHKNGQDPRKNILTDMIESGSKRSSMTMCGGAASTVPVMRSLFVALDTLDKIGVPNVQILIDSVLWAGQQNIDYKLPNAQWDFNCGPKHNLRYEDFKNQALDTWARGIVYPEILRNGQGLGGLATTDPVRKRVEAAIEKMPIH